MADSCLQTGKACPENHATASVHLASGSGAGVEHCKLGRSSLLLDLEKEAEATVVGSPSRSLS